MAPEGSLLLSSVFMASCLWAPPLGPSSSSLCSGCQSSSHCACDFIFSFFPHAGSPLHLFKVLKGEGMTGREGQRGEDPKRKMPSLEGSWPSISPQVSTPSITCPYLSLFLYEVRRHWTEEPPRLFLIWDSVMLAEASTE